MRQVILDTETTGLYIDQGHRIIEIGCVEMINRKVTKNHYHQYINPERDIEAEALAVHGISREFLQDKPTFKEIVEKFMAFIDGAELIIHNAPFDVGFINGELQLLRKTWKPLSHYCRVTDSLLMARQLHIGQRNSLDALCKRYFIDNTHREFHGALLDAHLLARVYLAMTGGQATLFGGAEADEIAAQQLPDNTQTPARVRDLPIMMATPEELLQHQARIQQMAKKGDCMWLSSDAEPA